MRITIILAFLLCSLLCGCGKVTFMRQEDQFWQVNDSAILNRVFARTEVLYCEKDSLPRKVLLPGETGPWYIKFTEGSVCMLSCFSPGCHDGYELIRVKDAYLKAEKYSREHSYFPWIQTGYWINPTTNVIEFEREEWPRLKVFDWVYRIEKIAAEEIVISYVYQSKESAFFLIRYQPVDSASTVLTQIRDDYFCCYDSLLCFIQQKFFDEGQFFCKDTLIHDHHRPTINNDSFWYEYKIKM